MSISPQFQSQHLSSDGTDSEWLSALHIAAKKGHDRIVRVLIQRNMDCNEKDSKGRTPLMHAVIENHEPVVSALISHGARSNEVDNLQRSVLHLAVIHRRENVLRALLEFCSERRQELDIDAYDASGKTPLHIAVEQGFESGVIILLRNGANINIKARVSI
ncbi:ankyrin repeat protein [Rutstroemia sp. NJR-2017a BVV2]|nr:ankyrin repeat protein [Rutstroemia sp. NJR-2017a BVV2]